MKHHMKVCLAGALACIATIVGTRSYAQVPVIQQTNLVTNNQAVNAARITDTNAVNVWGISFSPTSPFWVSNNGTGTSTLYNVNPTTNVPVKQGLTVTIPGQGTVTGQAFNSTAGAFNSDIFLFVSEDGTISGWRGALGTSAETLATGLGGNVYKGTTLATLNGHAYLYSANFHTGAVDVLKGDAGAPTLSGNFTDPGLPAGYAPFNVQREGNALYVTYAVQDAAKHDDVAGAGNGLVDAFDLNGNFLNRIATGGTLDSPWGIAIAPSSFGIYGGDLLVGNFGDGRINAFNLATNSFVGQLAGVDGKPLSIDGLWAITPGNGAGAGSTQNLYFSAGPNGEADGLFGTLAAVPEPQPALFAMAALVPAGVWLRRRRK